MDWERAQVAGEGAVEIRNPQLWRLLEAQPQFGSMNTRDLKEYIEWSGVIAAEETAEAEAKAIDTFEIPIGALELSTRPLKALQEAGISSVGEVLRLLTIGESELLAIQNFGQAGLEELKSRLRAEGYRLPERELETSERIADVLSRFEERLLKYPNVVGVELGFKEIGGRRTEDRAIVVQVSRKLPGSALSAEDRLPSQIEEVLIDVVEVTSQPEPEGERAPV